MAVSVRNALLGGPFLAAVEAGRPSKLMKTSTDVAASPRTVLKIHHIHPSATGTWSAKSAEVRDSRQSTLKQLPRAEHKLNKALIYMTDDSHTSTTGR
mgnify:CR=1 FL=1